MPFVSITRLRIRSLRFLPAFALHAGRTTRQVRAADGFRDGSILMDGIRTFWTMTAWDDGPSMRRYMTAGPHGIAMTRLAGWCDEASVVHWTQHQDALPPWAEADRRMRGEGRPSPVRHPGPDHAGLSFRHPRTGRTTRIIPAPARQHPRSPAA